MQDRFENLRVISSGEPPVGLDTTALIWLTITFTFVIFSGPAIISMIYLGLKDLREKREIDSQKLSPPSHPEEENKAA